MFPSHDRGGDTSFVDDDPVADVDFNVVTTPTVTEQERQQNIQDAEDFIVGTTDFPSAQNFGGSPNINFTPDLLADIQKNINLDNERILADDDTLFKNNVLTPAGQAELNKMNAETLQLVTSGEIPASNFISAGTSSDILGTKDTDLGVNLAKSATDTGLRGSLTPGVSQDVIDTAKNALGS